MAAASVRALASSRDAARFVQPSASAGAGSGTVPAPADAADLPGAPTPDEAAQLRAALDAVRGALHPTSVSAGARSDASFSSTVALFAEACTLARGVSAWAAAWIRTPAAVGDALDRTLAFVNELNSGTLDAAGAVCDILKNALQDDRAPLSRAFLLATPLKLPVEAPAPSGHCAMFVHVFCSIADLLPVICRTAKIISSKLDKKDERLKTVDAIYKRVFACLETLMSFVARSLHVGGAASSDRPYVIPDAEACLLANAIVGLCENFHGEYHHMSLCWKTLRDLVSTHFRCPALADALHFDRLVAHASKHAVDSFVVLSKVGDLSSKVAKNAQTIARFFVHYLSVFLPLYPDQIVETSFERLRRALNGMRSTLTPSSSTALPAELLDEIKHKDFVQLVLVLDKLFTIPLTRVSKPKLQDLIIQRMLIEPLERPEYLAASHAALTCLWFWNLTLCNADALFCCSAPPSFASTSSFSPAALIDALFRGLLATPPHFLLLEHQPGASAYDELLCSLGAFAHLTAHAGGVQALERSFWHVLMAADETQLVLVSLVLDSWAALAARVAIPLARHWIDTMMQAAVRISEACDDGWTERKLILGVRWMIAALLGRCADDPVNRAECIQWLRSLLPRIEDTELGDSELSLRLVLLRLFPFDLVFASSSADEQRELALYMMYVRRVSLSLWQQLCSLLEIENEDINVSALVSSVRILEAMCNTYAPLLGGHDVAVLVDQDLDAAVVMLAAQLLAGCRLAISVTCTRAKPDDMAGVQRFVGRLLDILVIGCGLQGHAFGVNVLAAITSWADQDASPFNITHFKLVPVSEVCNLIEAVAPMAIDQFHAPTARLFQGLLAAASDNWHKRQRVYTAVNALAAAAEDEAAGTSFTHACVPAHLRDEFVRATAGDAGSTAQDPKALARVLKAAAEASAPSPRHVDAVVLDALVAERARQSSAKGDQIRAIIARYTPQPSGDSVPESEGSGDGKRCVAASFEGLDTSAVARSAAALRELAVLVRHKAATVSAVEGTVVLPDELRRELGGLVDELRDLL